MRTTEILIHARWVIPVEPDHRVLEYHSLAIDDGRISAILPSAEARQSFQAQSSVDLASHAVIPGLVNDHTHAAMTLLRGIADDLHLMDWLQNHIWPAEQKWISEQFIHDGTQLAIAEMLRGGSTCFNDMYFFPEVTARVAMECGIRAQVAFPIIDNPIPGASVVTFILRRHACTLEVPATVRADGTTGRFDFDSPD